MSTSYSGRAWLRDRRLTSSLLSHRGHLIFSMLGSFIAKTKYHHAYKIGIKFKVGHYQIQSQPLRVIRDTFAILRIVPFTPKRDHKRGIWAISGHRE
jgi:hypothetical protein